MSTTQTEIKPGYLYEKQGDKVSLYIEPDVLSVLDSYAKAHGRSRSSMMNVLLRQTFGMANIEMIPKPVGKGGV